MKEIFIPGCWERISIYTPMCQKYYYIMVHKKNIFIVRCWERIFIKTPIYQKYYYVIVHKKDIFIVIRWERIFIYTPICQKYYYIIVNDERNIHPWLLGNNFYLYSNMSKILPFNRSGWKKYSSLLARKEFQYIFQYVIAANRSKVI